MAQLGAYSIDKCSPYWVNLWPLSCRGLLRLRRSKLGPQDLAFQPEVSIIFAAYNEKEVIEEKIHSIYTTDYDTTKISVFIGSDQSNDGTDEIITSLQSKYPSLHFTEPQSARKIGNHEHLGGKANR